MELVDPAQQAYEEFAGVYDRFTSANDYELWFGALLPRLREVGLRKGALLDVACGTGKGIGPMLDRGWQVTACDISAAMVEKAIEKHPSGVTFDVCDMRDLPVYGRFDLVWALNEPINYLLGDGDLVRALAAMAANLSDGGLLLFDCNTAALFRANFGAGVEDTRDGTWTWRGLGRKGDIYEAEVSGPGVATHVHRERYRSVAEVWAAMAEAGLSPLLTLGQTDDDRGLWLSSDWDDDRDHKIIHVAGKGTDRLN